MKTQLTTLLLVIFVLIENKILGQQQQMYTQYMFNGLAINPAYAGSHESLTLTALARKQWVGFEGAPSTQTFAAHSPIKNERVGLGFLFSRDNIGVTNQYTFNLAYAYRIPMGKGKLSMGVQGGFSNYNNAFTELYLGPNTIDPAFAQNTNNFTPSVGAGLYYYSEKFYLGGASPQLITYTSNTEEGSYSKQARHYFISTGYVFDLNKSLKLKPNALVKMVEGAPVQIDLNAHLLIKEVLWVGASYRSFESVSAMAQVQLTDQIRFGYSYDMPGTSSLGKMNSGSHELMLSYSFTFFKNRFASPRYF